MNAIRSERNGIAWIVAGPAHARLDCEALGSGRRAPLNWTATPVPGCNLRIVEPRIATNNDAVMTAGWVEVVFSNVRREDRQLRAFSARHRQ